MQNCRYVDRFCEIFKAGKNNCATLDECFKVVDFIEQARFMAVEEGKIVTCYAFVFARGGSKGLPGNNLKCLDGKPLLQYSIDLALKMEMIDDVFVSTDDEAIMSAAERFGAKVIIRPDHLATDNSPEWLSWIHAVKEVEKNFQTFQFFVSLPATSPLRSAKDVEDAISLVKSTDADVSLGITKSSHNPYFNMVKKDRTKFLKIAAEAEKNFVRRQDAPELFNVTTCVYVTTPHFIKNNGSLFSGNISGVEIPRERSVDIDDLYDFWMAETILRKNKNEL